MSTDTPLQCIILATIEVVRISEYSTTRIQIQGNHCDCDLIGLCFAAVSIIVFSSDLVKIAYDVSIHVLFILFYMTAVIDIQESEEDAIHRVILDIHHDSTPR